MIKAHCGTLFDNDAGFDTCEWNPDDICRGSTSQQCACSAISYVTWAACDACNDVTTTWDDYAQEFDCRGLPQQYPPPFPSGREEFASWAFAMVSATPTPTTFDLEAASAFALFPTTQAPPPTTQDTPTTPISPTTTPPTATPPTTTPPTTTPPTTAPPAPTETTARPTSSNVSTSVTASVPSGPRHTATESPSASGSQSIPVATPLPPVTASVSSGSNAIPTASSVPQLLSSAHRNKFPTGAIVGVVIGVCLILLPILFVCLRRRRQKPAYLTAFPVTPPDAGTAIPSYASISALDDSDLSSASVPDRHHLRTESRDRQEKTFAEESRSLTSSPSTYPPGGNVQLSAAFRTFGSESSGAPGPDVVWQLREMTARVRELEAQLESPPPGYSGEEP